MADNITLNSGSGGSVLAADDISSVFYQRVKINYGVDGSATDVSDTNPLPIDDAGGSLTIDNAALSVTGGGVEASALRVTIASDSTGVLSIDDNGSSVTVDNGGTFAVQAAQSGTWNVTNISGTVSLPTGAATSANQSTANTSLAAIQTAVEVIDNAISGTEMQVDIVAALPAGTNAIGKLSANSGVDIGDVDVTSIIPGTGATNLGKAIDSVAGATDTGVVPLAVRDDALSALTPIEGDYVALRTGSTGALWTNEINSATLVTNTTFGATTGGGVESGALRVTIASDSTGVVSVDDNGASITVDNAALSVTGGGVESGALRVTLANDSTGVISVDDNGSALTVDNAGTFAVQSTLQTGSALACDVGISGARTSGGTTIFRTIDLDETEEEVKATAGQVYWIHCMNLAATKRYLKIYNATAATVVVGTTTPVLTFAVASTGDTNGAGFVLSIPNGIAFSTAITIAATTGIADADTGAPGDNEVIVNMGYA